MSYKLVKPDNTFRTDNILLITLLAILIYYMYCNKNNNQNEDFTSEDIKKNVEIHNLKCSKDCCKWNQWPVSFFKPDKNAIPTNLMCNHGDGSGCVCMNKKALKQLQNRGGNNNC